MPGSPTNFDDSGKKTYCTFRRCGQVLFGFFLSSAISLFRSLSLYLGDGKIKTKMLSQRAVERKTTNQFAEKFVRRFCTAKNFSHFVSKYISTLGFLGAR